METGGIHKLIIGANIFSTKPLASKPRGCINSWLLDGRRPTQRKNQSVGYESKCPGLRLNFRQTFSCLERHFPFLGLTAWPRPTASARQPSDLGKESSSRGMKSLPSVLPRPGHLLSYPTERLFSLGRPSPCPGHCHLIPGRALSVPLFYTIYHLVVFPFPRAGFSVP